MPVYAIRHCVSLAILVCMTTTVGTQCKKDTQSIYYENLAMHRRQFKVTSSRVQHPPQAKYKHKSISIAPIYAVNDQLDDLLARKREVSKQVKYIPGYTIQVYIGASREEAFKVKDRLYTQYPAMIPKITYSVPYYTVHIGEFLDTLEAYPVYAAIRVRIPQAMIRPIYFANRPDVFIKK